MKDIIIAVEQYNASLPRDETYSDDYCNYLEVEKEMDRLVRDLLDALYEKCGSVIKRWHENGEIYNYSFPSELRDLVMDAAIDQVWATVKRTS